MIIKSIWVTLPNWETYMHPRKGTNPGHGYIGHVARHVRPLIEDGLQYNPHAQWKIGGVRWTFCRVAWDALVAAIETDRTPDDHSPR